MIIKWLQTYTGFWRNLRLAHFIYNFINTEKLKHNRLLFQKYGVRKSILASISSKDFVNKSARLPWLDYPTNKEKIMEHPGYMQLDYQTQQSLLSWYEKGYIILPAFFNNKTIDAINNEIDLLLETELLKFNYTKKKVMNAFQYSDIIRKAINDKRLKKILEFILNRPVFPFQTINFIQGSEQAAHSDAIHMSTFPQGNLIATWIALEDIEEDAGAIQYYPGSHHLSYLTNADIEAKNNWLILDSKSNEKHEKKTSQLIKENNLEAHTFLPKKGDILIWHSNLIHGGLPIKNNQLTRKSMVIHYFANDVICYHEIGERPALLESITDY